MDQVPVESVSPAICEVIRERAKQFNKGFDKEYVMRHDPEKLVALSLDFALDKDLVLPAVIVRDDRVDNWVGGVAIVHDHMLENAGWEPNAASTAHRHTRKEQLIAAAALLLAAYDRMVAEENGD